MSDRPPLALVTGASTGIGLELSRRLAQAGHEVLMVADEREVEAAARTLGPGARALQADLATQDGVENLLALLDADGRVPAVVALNAAVGLGGRFVDSDLQKQLRLVRLDVESTVQLAHVVLRQMVAVGAGGLLITSSVASQMPGPLNSTYAASKSFVQSFGRALRGELGGTGVRVTVVLPGPTDTAFFRRAGMERTRLARGRKDDPAVVARQALDALEAGRPQVVAGARRNRRQVVLARLLPDGARATLHRRLDREVV